jgi:hypothetical protein
MEDGTEIERYPLRRSSPVAGDQSRHSGRSCFLLSQQRVGIDKKCEASSWPRSQSFSRELVGHITSGRDRFPLAFERVADRANVG